MGGKTKIMTEGSRNKIPLFFFVLGFWLLAAPATFGCKLSLMCFSDYISGILLCVLGLLAYKTALRSLYVVGVFIGIWLQMAPLLFWAKEPSFYVSDTLIGFLVITLSNFLLGFFKEEKEEESNPPGWSFNPSAWSPRIVTIFLAMVCWFLSRYLASYQLGYIHEVYDPFFQGGTEKVITSSVSKLFPVPDAGLGAFVYFLEFLLGWMGGFLRWRKMPWLTIFFGAMVVPAGMVSILLIASQPVFVGAWCGICLVIAFCMLIMILLTAPEVVATVELLVFVKKNNKNFWKVFWSGINKSELPEKPACYKSGFFASLGLSFPWNLLLSACIGIWLMSSSALLGIARPGADSLYIVGPLLFAFSVISLSKCIRFIRFLNLPLAVVLFSAPLWMDGFSVFGTINNVFIGIVIFLLCFKKEKSP